MDIKIQGNPGTGNTFQETIYNIGRVENFNPNATVVNNYYGARVSEVSKSDISTKSNHVPGDGIDESPKNLASLREEILEYVAAIRPLLKDEWKQSYERLWLGIMELKAVSSEIYEIGRQQGTNFNRNLVANIIHYLDRQGLYRESYNAADLTRRLEGSSEHSVRQALSNDPTEPIRKALDHYFENLSL